MINNKQQKRLKIFTWHVHGSYLYYLSQTDCELFIPFKKDRDELGYGGKIGPFPWKENIHEIEMEEVPKYEFDCILFQNKKNYLEDQYKILTSTQRELPKVYLEHDPPRAHPTDTKHVVDDKDTIIVHVTPFNNLMWDSGQTPTVVIDHGVIQPKSKFTGELNKGIVVVNNIKLRGRRLGYDIFEYVRKLVPLDIIGMGTDEIGGLGEIPHDQIPNFISQYRFFFNPIRYTSLGLSVIEAMMTGLPIVGISTTELSTVIKNGFSGFIDTDIDTLIEKMHFLIKNKSAAMKMGKNSSEIANKRFNIDRFSKDWEKIFNFAVYRKRNRPYAPLQNSFSGNLEQTLKFLS